MLSTKEIGLSKRLLIIKASSDICAAEIDHIKTVAEMFGIEHCTAVLRDVNELVASKLNRKRGRKVV